MSRRSAWRWLEEHWPHPIYHARMAAAYYDELRARDRKMGGSQWLRYGVAKVVAGTAWLCAVAAFLVLFFAFFFALTFPWIAPLVGDGKRRVVEVLGDIEGLQGGDWWQALGLRFGSIVAFVVGALLIMGGGLWVAEKLKVVKHVERAYIWGALGLILLVLPQHNWVDAETGLLRQFWLDALLRDWWLPVLQHVPGVMGRDWFTLIAAPALLGAVSVVAQERVSGWWTRNKDRRYWAEWRASMRAEGIDISRVPLRQFRMSGVDAPLFERRLSWTDEYPTGRTKGMVLDEWERKFGLAVAVVCAVVGLGWYGLQGLLVGGFIGLFVGSLARRNAEPPDFRIPISGQMAGIAPKKRLPSELEPHVEAEAETDQEDCDVYLVEASEGGPIYLAIERGDRENGVMRVEVVSWESFDNFIEDDFGGWFRSRARYSPVSGDRCVVIAPQGKAPMLISHWAHEAAFTIALRSHLQTMFGDPYRHAELEKRGLAKARGGTETAASDDIPKTL